MPDNPEERRLIIDEFMAGGAGIERSPKHYIEFREVAPDIVDQAALVANNTKIPDSDIRASGLLPEQLRWAPIVSRRGEGAMLIDTNNGRPLRVSATPPD